MFSVAPAATVQQEGFFLYSSYIRDNIKYRAVKFMVVRLPISVGFYRFSQRLLWITLRYIQNERILHTNFSLNLGMIRL
jgi:hypothetical protein